MTPPSGGTYFVRLGDDLAINDIFPPPSFFGEPEAHRLTYCFEIDNDNSDFFFNYALVLEDGNDAQPHPEEEQPFFEWSVKDSEGNVIDEDKIPADIDNHFFDTENFLAWKGWTCQFVDLNNHVGEEVCMEFIIADCSQRGHYGYVYIDALCSNEEDVAPVPILNLNEVYCQNQITTVSGEQSYGYNQYSWNVCRYDNNGNPFECFSIPKTVGFPVPDFEDILNFFFEENSPSTGLNCNDRFQVTLTLYNDCGSSSDSKDFTYICEESIVDYNDILFCGGNLNLPITGENDCDGCPVSWSPGQYLDDPNIAFPTLMGDLNVNTFDQIYSVRVVNDFGCIYRDEVNVYGRDDISGQVEIEVIDLNHCERTFEVHVQLDSELSTSDLVVTLDVEGETPFVFLSSEAPDNYPEFPLKRFIATATVGQTADSHIFTIPEIFSKRYNLTVTATVSFVEITEDWTVYGNCTLSETTTVEAGQWHGSLLYLMPAQFDPGHDIEEKTIFGPVLASNPQNDNQAINRNAYEAWLRVIDEWGGLAFEGHATTNPSLLSATGISFVDPAIQWDGKIGGQPANQGTYTWTFGIQNCDFAPAGCFSGSIDVWDNPPMQPIGDCNPGDGADCETIYVTFPDGQSTSSPRFCGSVTLAYGTE